MILTPLYHWSPADRHESIRRHGLRPGSDPTVASGRLPYVCLGADPLTAWSISGATGWCTEIEQWDLWLVHIAPTDDLYVRPMFGPKIEEIKVRGCIPPDRIWWIGRRDDTGVPADLREGGPDGLQSAPSLR